MQDTGQTGQVKQENLDGSHKTFMNKILINFFLWLFTSFISVFIVFIIAIMGNDKGEKGLSFTILSYIPYFVIVLEVLVMLWSIWLARKYFVNNQLEKSDQYLSRLSLFPLKVLGVLFVAYLILAFY